jgi:hypothetical protein
MCPSLSGTKAQRWFTVGAASDANNKLFLIFLIEKAYP